MLRPPRPRIAPAVGVLVLAATAVLAVGCSPSPAPAPSSSVSTTASASAPQPTPSVAATIEPEGTAADNLPVFQRIVGEVWTTGDRAAGRAYIDALVAVGFDKAAMQVTQDTTTLGDPAESIQFSVLWNDGQCLVGQVGPATGDPVTAVLPAVGDGTCLIGETRAIDW